jgi:hypothetical protein
MSGGAERDERERVSEWCFDDWDRERGERESMSSIISIAQVIVTMDWIIAERGEEREHVIHHLDSSGDRDDGLDHCRERGREERDRERRTGHLETSSHNQTKPKEVKPVSYLASCAELRERESCNGSWF